MHGHCYPFFVARREGTMTQATEGKELLNPEEAAAFIGLKAQTLAVWRCAGTHPELPYVKVGARIRYRRSDLVRWLEMRTVSGSSATATDKA
jgi:hypothetical protein